MTTAAIPLRPDVDTRTGEAIDRPQRPAFITVGEPKDLAKLFAKMAKVLQEIGRVAKSGHNDQQNYDYATEADLLDEIRPLLAKHGVAFFPTVVHSEQRDGGKTRNGNVKTITRVEMQTAFCCVDTGAMLVSTWHGEAEDTGDKSYWKAYTGTLKYAHSKTWMVSTGDDPENDRARAETGGEPAKQQARTSQDKPRRNEFHERVLATIRSRLDEIPDGFEWEVDGRKTRDLKRYAEHVWELLEKNVENAKTFAHAVDAAHKAVVKQKRGAKKGAAANTEEENRKKLHGRYMALLAEKAPGLAKHEGDRHRFQKEVIGKESTSKWGIGDYEKAIIAVEDGTAATYDLPM